MSSFKSIVGVLALTLVATTALLAQTAGSIDGQVVDSQGAAVIGATVKAVDKAGKEFSAVTDQNGRYRIRGLVAGTYSLKAESPGFSVFETTDIEVEAGKSIEIPVLLSVAGITEQVDVEDEGSVSTDNANNASALILKEEDLEALPDDPDDLETALQALAGGAAGPNGGQIYIDGFEGGNLPPKEAIREIRINRNPFSAEYERLGFGRIEILTKPGSDKFRGQAYFNFNDDAFNTRNPFSENKADSRRMFYGGNISGPLVKGKASYFLSLNNRDISSGQIVNATIIDPAFNIVPFQQEFTVPNKRFSISPRLDYQLNENNTLVGRYEFERRTSENQGIGGFTLPTRGISSENTEHTLQLTETAILNARTVNETRFQFRSDSTDRMGDSTDPAINVQAGFVGGGATTGFSFDRSKRWELQNYTTTALGKDAQHAIKFGVRVRGAILDDRSESNYNGTYTFSGFLDDNGTPDPADDVFVSSIEQYRQKLLGNPDPRYNPNQFSITDGNPLASISQYDIGLFLMDDWRVSPGLTLGFGLRYENQTNISDGMNFAPRLNFAYSPGAGGARAPKDVFRGGIGVFYSRFNQNTVLTAERLDGVSQQQFILNQTNDTLGLLGQPVFGLNGVANTLTAAQLLNVEPGSSTPRVIDPNARAPYTIQGAFSYERQLPGRSTVSVYYVASKNLHLLRSRNINAPVCPSGAVCPVDDEIALNALRPDPTAGNIYQFETSGVQTSQQMIISFRTFFSQSLTLFSNYRLGKTEGNSDGGFPSYSYDVNLDEGSSSRDRRHFFFLGGSVGLPWGGISLRPFVIAGSGTPFDITAGQDRNGDSIFNDRPTFAELSDACLANGITASWCDTAGNDPNAIIPRNFGRGPSFFTINLGIDKNFGFGGSGDTAQSQSSNSSGRGGRRGGRRGGNVFGGGRRGSSRGGGRSPYNLSVGLRFRNLLNTNNQNAPVGTISSNLFGQSTDTIGGFGRGGSSGGNRTVELRLRFRW